MFTVSTVLERKTPRFDAVSCVIRDVVCLSDPEFKYFSNNLLCDHEFLDRYKDKMGHDETSCHCILVLGESCDDGILVNSEGYSYARYAALMPGAKAYLNHQMTQITNRIIDAAIHESKDGKWFLDYDRFEAEEGLSLTGDTYLLELLQDKLFSRLEVRAVNIGIEGIGVGIDPWFCDWENKSTQENEMKM